MRGSQAVFHLGTFSYHPYIILHFGFDYENETQFYVLVTFGAEPKDYEVYEFLLKNWDKLKFSPSIEIETAQDRKINPKRMQREISSHLQNKGIGTKAQQALKLQHEQNKVERITKSREQREAEQDRQYALRQKKKKEKHRGR